MKVIARQPFTYLAVLAVAAGLLIQCADARLGAALNETRGFKDNLKDSEEEEEEDYEFYDFKIIEHPSQGAVKVRYLKEDPYDFGSNIVEPKTIDELKELAKLGETFLDLGPKFFKHMEKFLSFDCGGGFAYMHKLSDIGMDFEGTPLEFLGSFNLFEILQDIFDKILKRAGIGSYLLPQKVCATDDYDLSQLGHKKGIDACQYMTSLGGIDVWAFGGGIGKKNLCAAFSFETLTISFAQRNIIPVLNLPSPVRRRQLEATYGTMTVQNNTLPIPARGERQLEPVSITVGTTAAASSASNLANFLKSLKIQFYPKVISLSFLRGLRTPTYTKLWDGKADPTILNIPGNFRFGGAGELGFGFGAANFDIKGTIEFDGAFTFDTDFSGDGLENVLRGDLLDMAFLIQGKIVPKFEVFQLWELNFAEVFKGFVADMYTVISGEETRIQIGAIVELDLGGICKIAPQFEFLCDIFTLDAGLQGSVNAYVSKHGVGVRLDGRGHFKLNPNPLYDWVLDALDLKDGIAVEAGITAQIGHSSHICVVLRDGDSTQKFCTPKNYGRGVGRIPGAGRPADCPSGYEHILSTCFRGTDDYLAPSKPADCPSGYNHILGTCNRPAEDISAPSKPGSCPSGYNHILGTCNRPSHDIHAPSKPGHCPPGYNHILGTCNRGAHDIHSPSRPADCPPGYTHILGTCNGGWSILGPERMTCPGGYHKGGIGTCYKNCPEGYHNAGDNCHRPVSILGADRMTCPGGYDKVGSSCRKHCPAGYSNNGEFCHRPVHILNADHMTCPSGYSKGGIGSCYKNCPDGYTNTGELCHRPVHILSSDHMTCPDGYNKGGIGTCYKKCRDGYKNMGETCHRPPSSLKNTVMSCRPGETLKVDTCFPPGGARCFPGEEEDAGLCYKKCDKGYKGIGPMCWKEGEEET